MTTGAGTTRTSAHGGRHRKNRAERRALAKRLAGGAAVNAALAAGALVTMGTATAEADTTPTSVTCTPSDGADCPSAFGPAVHSVGGVGPRALTLDEAGPAIRLFGPGGVLIGNGLDATALDPSCTAGCVGGNGGLLWGSGGAGAYGGDGGKAGMIGVGGAGGA
ncbi:hypothetical protein WN67_13365, partial [Mycolicibacterium obuense]